MVQRLTPDQFRRVRRLVRTECANYNRGNCLLLEEDGESCECPQMISQSLLCRYFREAVLPGNAELLKALVPGIGQRCCPECCQPFTPQKTNTRYCPACAQARARRSKRAWAAKRRLDRRKSSGRNA